MDNSPLSQQLRAVRVFVSLATVLVCYNYLPAVGALVMVPLDRIAFGLRWLDILSPATAWGILGALLTGLFGAVVGLARAGLPGQGLRMSLWGGGAVLGLIVLGLLYCAVMPPVKRGTSGNGLQPIYQIRTWLPNNGQ